MKVVSINVGLPRTVSWQGVPFRTGIYKAPVEGEVSVGFKNLDGDGQADVSVHGGRDKAVYAYPSEHYLYWRDQFPEVMMPWGMFGENLTTTGLTEETVRIGDLFRVGSAELVVTQPRMPCSKLGMRFRNKTIIKRFLESRRSGWYCSVAREGRLASKDEIQLVGREPESLSVKEVLELYGDREANTEVLKKVIQIKGLSKAWRDHFRRRLENR